MKFFKPEDFNYCLFTTAEAISIADRANKKLERQGQVVYAYTEESNAWWLGTHADYKIKGLLINIEPIEKCKHFENFSYSKITNNGPEYLAAYCRVCGQNFKLEEIK